MVVVRIPVEFAGWVRRKHVVPPPTPHVVERCPRVCPLQWHPWILPEKLKSGGVFDELENLAAGFWHDVKRQAVSLNADQLHPISGRQHIDEVAYTKRGAVGGRLDPFVIND
jgi:hypothetical protein